LLPSPKRIGRRRSSAARNAKPINAAGIDMPNQMARLPSPPAKLTICAGRNATIAQVPPTMAGKSIAARRISARPASGVVGAVQDLPASSKKKPPVPSILTRGRPH
jgi:hypothetical protein